MDDANEGTIRVGWTVAALALVVAWGYALFAYPGLPEHVPSHFDLAGRPNGWGSKSFLLAMPAAATITCAAVFLLRNLRPNVPFSVRPENWGRVKAISRGMVASLMGVIAVGILAMEVAAFRGAVEGAMPPAFTYVAYAMTVAVFGCMGMGIYRMYRAA